MLMTFVIFKVFYLTLHKCSLLWIWQPDIPLINRVHLEWPCFRNCFLCYTMQWIH